jgi:hypothetical protein
MSLHFSRKLVKFFRITAICIFIYERSKPGRSRFRAKAYYVNSTHPKTGGRDHICMCIIKDMISIACDL